MEKEIRESYEKAGNIAAQALRYGESLIVKGALMVDVLDKIENKIFDLGGNLAFPAQISINNIAAHYCPEEGDEFKFDDEVCCLDVGVHVDGYIGDNALTVDLSREYDDLVKASRDALNNAINMIKPGVTLGEIGKVIQDTISGYGYSPVRNLSGHGLDKYVQHTSPSIPNFDTKEGFKIEKGMVFAIEPFASTGSGVVQDSGTPTVFSVVQKKPVRSIITRAVLKEIESFNGLPFSKRLLTKKFGAKANFALRELEQNGIIKGYAPLADSGKGMVSQAEHTVIVEDKAVILTKI